MTSQTDTKAAHTPELVYLDTGEIFETSEDGDTIGDPIATLQHAILDDDAHALGMMMAAARELFGALQLAERTISGTLTARGYQPGSCSDEWAPEVRAEVAALASIRAALSRAGAQP